MKLGIVMDPITGIDIRKDSSFAMLLAAQALDWQIYYMEMADLFIAGCTPCARMRRLTVADDSGQWFEYGAESTAELKKLDIILMRKDPPVDMEYIYITQLLDLAQLAGVCIVNDPAALRDANEKLFIHWFPDYIAPTLVTSVEQRIVEFARTHDDIILKPLGNMGGASVFRLGKHDSNLPVVIETLTANGTKLAMAQRYIPEIIRGDKRILLIDGEPVPYALARVPMPGEHRGNLASGGAGKGVELTSRDRAICAALGPVLRDKGIIFAGIDVIGDYLTEINITSPTCIRELDALFKLDIAGDLMRALATHIEGGADRH